MYDPALNPACPWRRFLRLILWLVAVHSTGVGLALIVRPPTLMEWAGYARGAEPFFAIQNGVFHLVLAIGYAWGAVQPVRGRCLIVFTVVVKSAAAVFLLLYYFAFDPRWVILISGVGDGLMAVVVAAVLCRADREMRLRDGSPPSPLQLGGH